MDRKILGAIVAIIIVGSAGAAWVMWPILFPPLPENPYDVAIVFGTGGLGDLSFNDGCNEGAQRAVTELGINYTYSTPDTVAEFLPLLRGYCEHEAYSTPYKLIIGIGFEIADDLATVAAEYPDQNFAIIDVFWLNTTALPNVAQLNFAEEQGSALVGALAGLTTTQDKIAFVGGKSEPLIWKFGAGYFWGANLTNPNLNITATSAGDNLFSYVGDWTDPVTGESQADGHYASGADIIFAAAGGSGSGVLTSARENNGSYPYPIWAIGVDSPQMQYGIPEGGTHTVVLTSMLKRVDNAVFNTINATINDEFDTVAGLTYFNLTTGGVGWERNDTLLETPLPQAHVDMVNMIATGIENGTYVVPTEFDWLKT